MASYPIKAGERKHYYPDNVINRVIQESGGAKEDALSQSVNASRLGRRNENPYFSQDDGMVDPKELFTGKRRGNLNVTADANRPQSTASVRL